MKIRGHRIELEEIEAVLGQHEGVRAGVVGVVGEGGASKRLVAYVVPDWSGQAGGSELERASRQAGGNLRVGGEEVIEDGVERLRFKLGQPGLRREEGGEWVQLVRPVMEGGRLEEHVGRRSYRQYSQRVIPLAAMSELLSCLMQVEVGGNPCRSCAMDQRGVCIRYRRICIYGGGEWKGWRGGVTTIILRNTGWCGRVGRVGWKSWWGDGSRASCFGMRRLPCF